MIVGVGVDVADVARFATALERTPALRDRLFTPEEIHRPSGGDRTVASLAARFAVKEAVAKALGAPGTLRWHDCEVVSEDSGQPTLRITGTVAEAAASRGITQWHVSLSHDGGVAMAMVIAEGPDPR